MHLVALGWIYVVLMMAVAEAMSTQGTVLGAVITFLLYGVLPLSVVLYILGTPARRRLRARAEAQLESATALSVADAAGSPEPDGRSVSPGDTVTAERKEI